ncbi:MAG: EAL domain-containing protein [Xanthomonadaceae bacterium]|nr:EAL domain-containing protein [Xanthomonadaceae bacterium]
MTFKFGLQARFLLLMSLGLVVTLLMLGILLQRQEVMLQEVSDASNDVIRHVADRRVRADGIALSNQLSVILSVPMRDGDREEVQAVLARFSGQRDMGIRYAQAYGPDGAPLLQNIGENAGETGAAGPEARLGRDTMELRQYGDVLDITAPVMAGDERVGILRLGLATAMMGDAERSALSALDERLRVMDMSNRHWLVLLMSALVAAGVLSAWYIQYILVAPLRRLAMATRKMEAGKYGTGMLVSRHPGELGEPIRDFGHMRQRIVRHDRQVRKIAYADPLVGLLDRFTFCEQLESRLATAQGNGEELALLFIGVDEFKRVNDILGREAGDQFLLRFAERICKVVGQDEWSGAVLARFGGGEFVILIQGRNIGERAERLARTLIDEMRHPLSIQDRRMHFGISIGIALYPVDGMESTGLLKNGDTAMYQAKFSGKNCYRFYDRMVDLASERMVRLEQELRGAWERGEISVFYQPIASVETGGIGGAEALLRWNHPVLGEIEPDTFIGAAERIGMIESIGLHVMREACVEAVRWNDAEAAGALFVSVNISSYQLLNDELPGQVKACLAETGLPPSLLHLELTETSMLEDEQHAASIFNELQALGVEIWLDDFGAGFSRFNQLRHAAMNGIKIDRSFVMHLRPDTGDWTLVSTMISMANSLGMEVIAEGVEKEEQHEFLKQLGCHMEQGFWLGAPVDAAEFESMRKRMS